MTTLSALLALALFVDVSKHRAFSLVIAGLGLVCAAVGARLRLPWPWAVGFAFLVGLPSFLLTGKLYESTAFVSSFALGSALTVALCQCLMLVRVQPPREELLAACFPLCLTMASAQSFDVRPVDVLVISTAQILLLALGMRSRRGLRFRWLPVLLYAPACAAAVGLALFLQWSETKVNVILSLMTPSLSTSFAFPANSRLSSMLKAQTSPLVVLRFFGDHPPQYLVGRCYSIYEDFTWSAPTGSRMLAHGADTQSFSLSNTPLPASEYDRIELAGRGQVLFVPRDVKELSCDAPAFKVFFGGGLDSTGSFSGEYALARIPGSFLPTAEDELEAKQCLQLPKKLDPIVAELAHDWTSSCRNDMDRANTLTNYLQDHFTYGFGYPFEKSTDPVAEFLQKRPAAHCELFASSLTLMLRTLGIPARYINGFVIKEHSPTGGYSLARARDCHAWVEACVGGHWVRLDPTPPAELAAPSGPAALTENLFESLFYYWGVLSRMTPGDFLAGCKRVAHRYYPVALLLMAAYLIGPRLRRLSWRGLFAGKAASAELKPEQLPVLLMTLEAKAAQAGLVRQSDQTVKRWTDALRIRERTAATVEFLEDYNYLRYGQAAVEPEQLLSLESQLERALRELQTLQEESHSVKRVPPP